MSIIQRPTKQGGATTYQGKVTAGYTKILAAEVDADLDLIYSAWNQGVDAVNIQDGSITGAKLAPEAVGSRELADGGVTGADIALNAIGTGHIVDGQITQAKLAPGVTASPSGTAGGRLVGSYPNPGLAADVEQAVAGDFRARGTLTLTLGPAGSGNNWNGQPDSMDFVHEPSAAAASTLLRMTGDSYEFYQHAPNVAYHLPLRIQSDAIVVTEKQIQCQTYAGGQFPSGDLGYGSGTSLVGCGSVWFDSGGVATPVGGELVAPAYGNTIVTIGGKVTFSANGNFGVALGLYYLSGAQWIKICETASSVATTLTVSTVWPAVPNQHIRIAITNGTGAAITVLGGLNTYQIMVVHGRY